MSWLPFDPQHPPTDKEYQYYADLLGWEKEPDEINDLDFLAGNAGISGYSGTTTPSSMVF